MRFACRFDLALLEFSFHFFRASLRKSMKTWGFGLAGITLSMVAVATPTYGAVFLSEVDANVRPVHFHAVISFQPPTTTLVESVEVQSSGSRFVWLKPFPVRPNILVKPDLTFRGLEQETTVPAPYNFDIRNDLFGPSSVSWLMREVIETRPARPESPPVPRLAISEYEVFDGQVQTSTITGRMVLPERMRKWLARGRYPVSERLKSSIAGHLNRGWVLVALHVEDREPRATQRGATVPVMFRFPSDQPLLPLLRQPQRLAEDPSFDIWTLAARPLGSADFPQTWADRPWDPAEERTGHYCAVFSRQVEPRDALATILAHDLDLRLPPTPQLVRHRFRHGDEIWREHAFAGTDAPRIPGWGARGGLVDIVLCLLLGMTPLLFTPESWFLRWLVARGRAREAQGESPWPNLWAFYAILVAAYWLMALDGLGRLAALTPLAVGVTQLLWPSVPRRRGFVRVQFANRAKADA